MARLSRLVSCKVICSVSLRGTALVHHVGHGEEVCLVGIEEFFGEAQLGDAVAAGQREISSGDSESPPPLFPLAGSRTWFMKERYSALLKESGSVLIFCVSTHGKFDLEFKNFSKLGIFAE